MIVTYFIHSLLSLWHPYSFWLSFFTSVSLHLLFPSSHNLLPLLTPSLSFRYLFFSHFVPLISALCLTLIRFPLLNACITVNTLPWPRVFLATHWPALRLESDRKNDHKEEHHYSLPVIIKKKEKTSTYPFLTIWELYILYELQRRDTSQTDVQ